MLAKNLTDVTLGNIQQLIAAGVSESKYLEYKADVHWNSLNHHRDWRKELCKDLSALANAAGGDFIIGIRECNSGPQKGRPERIVPVQEPFESIRERIQNTVDAHIQPRLQLDFHAVDVTGPDGEAGIAVVIRVAQSFSGPHMVKFNTSTKFYTRTSHGVLQIVDVNELRQAFLASDTYEERINNWRIDRLGKVMAGETPVPLASEESLVLHLIPVGNFINNNGVALDPDHELAPPDGGGGGQRINFEGIIAPSAPVGQLSHSYAQLFRNGMVEALLGGIVAEDSDGNGGRARFIRMKLIEEELVRATRRYIDYIVSSGANYPVLLQVALLNVQDTHSPVHTNGDLRSQQPNKHRNLVIPGVLIEHEAPRIESTLRPVFDTIANALGHPASVSYGDDGSWDPQRWAS